MSSPTLCRSLVTGWPAIVGVMDASAHGVSGIIIREMEAISLTVFCLQWPRDIQQDIISETNPAGSLPKLDLELAALVLLFSVIVAIGSPL